MSKIDILESNLEDIICINGYIIKERIGVGSYGRVYKVLKKNTYYVLKEIPLNLPTAVEKINSVQNEAQILSSLNNKYIVKFYESFKMSQNIYIIMEYCDNGDLCTFLNEIKKKRKSENHILSKDFVWKLFIQMSIGLYYIHSKKIIHRDIKTLNIFLTKNLDAKIGDLGVAKILENTNHANTFIGTPYYVSPEMCQNKPYNEKSDIWALGCILYELITFDHPFTASNQAALFIKILKGNMNPFPPDTPEDLKLMVEYILQKDCNQRPSMEDIITSYNFQYNAIRVGLEKDLQEVLGVDKLPIYNINNILNDNYIISTSHTFLAPCNNRNRKKSKEHFIKNQKNNLMVCKSFNPINLYDKKCFKISSRNKFVNKKFIYKNKSYKKNKNENKIIISEGNNSNFKLEKLYNFKETDEYMSKRTKSDLNFKTNFNSAKKEKIIKVPKKTDNKNTKNNFCTSNKEKKNNNFNIMIKNTRKKYIVPSNTKFHINSIEKIKNISEKNTNSIINNSSCNNNNESTGKKTNPKNKYLKYKEKKNYLIKICESPIEKLVKESKLIKKNDNNQKEISIDNIIKRKMKKHSTLPKKDVKYNNKIKENLNLYKTDIIVESEFMKELNNTIKTTPVIINLNDLLNFNFNSDDSKNLNTTSATTSLGKIEFPTITAEEIVEINEDNSNLLKNADEENSEIFNVSCDEFTETEMIKRSEPYLSKQIPFSDYKIKINENKKEIKHIIEMPKDELMSTSLLYKNEYDKYMDKFKKYSDIIDLNEVKNIYKEIKNLNDKKIKKIMNFIFNMVNKKIPEKNVNELIDILYNIISYDIKYKIAEKTIHKN